MERANWTGSVSESLKNNANPWQQRQWIVYIKYYCNKCTIVLPDDNNKIYNIENQMNTQQQIINPLLPYNNSNHSNYHCENPRHRIDSLNTHRGAQNQIYKCLARKKRTI